MDELATTQRTDELLAADQTMLALFIDIQHGQSERTAKTYEQTLTAFIRYVNQPMRYITLQDIVDYAKSLSNLAPTTQNRIMSTIRSFFTFLSAQPGYLAANVMAVYKSPKVERSLEIDNILTKDEVKRILDVLRYRNFRNWVICGVLLSTGLRVSELTSAKWCNVSRDFDDNIGLTIVGKGKKRRTVKLTPKLFDNIVKYREMCGLDTTIGSGDDSPLFANRNHAALTSRYIEQIVREAGEVAGIGKHVHPHMFRHYNATMALYNGANIHVVQQSLGHSSIAVTNAYLWTVNKLNDTTADYVDLDM